MTKPILIAGGYGLVGGMIARKLREMLPDTPLVLGGRTQKKGEALAAELGNAHAVALDTSDPDAGFEAAGEVGAVIAALTDPHDRLLKAALARAIPHLSITRSVTEMAPLLAYASHAGPRSPVVPLAHWQAGVMTLAAIDLAASFETVSRIHMAALFDMADPIGPMTAEDAEDFFGTAMTSLDGQWRWVDPEAEARQVTVGADTFDARPMSVLDVPSLRAATGAADIRFDLGIGTSKGTHNGTAASHDMAIRIEGTGPGGTPLTRSRFVCDPKGQAHLTATGAALAVARVVVGPPAPGIYMPETLLDAADAVSAFRSHDIEVTDDA